MKQVICDRCGKVIDYSQGKPVFTIIRTNTCMIMDMCKDCRKDLINFMHNIGNEKVEADTEPLDVNHKAYRNEMCDRAGKCDDYIGWHCTGCNGAKMKGAEE